MSRNQTPAPDAGAERPARARRLDDLDRRILAQMQEDASVSSAELARRVDLSPAGLQKRVKKLQEAGVILRQVALLNREAIDLDLLCFVHVTLAHHQPDAVRGFRAAIQRMPEVLECHHISGEYDYLLKVVAEDIRCYEDFLLGKLATVPNVGKVHTSFVLSTVKYKTKIPVKGP